MYCVLGTTREGSLTPAPPSTIAKGHCGLSIRVLKDPGRMGELLINGHNSNPQSIQLLKAAS